MSARSLSVHFLPDLIEQSKLTGSVAVIIDVLRASSTIITALANGARSVIPCATPDQALEIRSGTTDHSVLAGGERHGVRIAGFDLGNSPADYTPAAVADRSVAFTTTNGTRALLAAKSAEVILIGAFLNLSAVVEQLKSQLRAVHLVCAGTDGAITGEDVLFTGAVVTALIDRSEISVGQAVDWSLNDSARIASAMWKQAVGSAPILDDFENVVLKQFRFTSGGRNLLELGYDSDLELCSRIDAYRVVPKFDQATGSILAVAAE